MDAQKKLESVAGLNGELKDLAASIEAMTGRSSTVDAIEDIAARIEAVLNGGE